MKTIKKHKFIIFIIVLVLIKQLLMSHVSIFAIGDSGCDDQLMVKLSSNILNMNWLGGYNHLTHVKGVFFPLFLSFNTALGISYINAVTLFYSISCIIFVYSIKDILKKSWMKYVLFIVLLFNPIMYTSDVVQRVYRNSLTPSQVLLILSSFFYIFINRKSNKNKKLLLMSILGGLTLASFYNTREDAIWIMPFVIVFTLIFVIEHIKINKKKSSIKRLIIFILPIVLLFITNISISLINYKVYGSYVRVDESGTPFAKTIEAMYSVPPKDNIEYVSNTKEKLERLYEVSPTLNSIKDQIEVRSKAFDKADRNPGDGEIEDGWFWWVLRFAAYDKGYYKDIKTADKFYNDITNEIKKAQEEGKIEKQRTMPSPLMSPYREGYTSKLFSTLIDIYKFTNNFEGTGLGTELSVGSTKNIGLFEVLTNDKAIYPYLTTLYGTYNNIDHNNIKITYEGRVLKEIECLNDECYIEFISNEELDYKKIYLEIEGKDSINIYDFIKESELVDSFYKIEKDNFNLNYYSNYEVTKNELKVASIYNKKINIISYIYKALGLIIGIISLILYLIFTFITLFRNRKYMEKWLIISSVIASYLVLALGVSYNHISSCDSISTLYLSGAYPLIIIFDSLIIFTFINDGKTIFKK